MPDWTAIKAEYERGQSSLSSLERAHGVSRQAIKKRAMKENWVTPRLQVTVTPGKQGVINRDVNAGVRVAQAIKRRQEGWTYQRIATDCSYASAGAARNAIQRELQRVIVQGIEAWRNDHTARLEKLHEEAWSLAMNPKNKWRLLAFDRLLAIAEREAKLLGLDTPVDNAAMANITVIREVPSNYLGLSEVKHE